MPEHSMQWRKWQRLFLLMLAVMLFLSRPPVLAQDNSRVLAPGSTLAGVLGPDQTATSYVFDAAAGARLSLIADNADGVALALLVSDSNGNAVARATDAEASGTVRIEDAALTAGGRYFAVVYYAPGSVIRSTLFDLTLALGGGAGTGAGTAAAAPPPAQDSSPPALLEQVLIPGGIEVRLDWTGDADMNLQVRAPSGETLYWDSRTTSNGGSFGFDANGLCEVISGSPVETATWQPGFLHTGSYEVLIFYREACSANLLSVPFTAQVTVNGVLSGEISGILAPPVQGQNSVYVARFEIDADGNAVVSSGGIYPDSSLTLLPATFNLGLDSPAPIQRGQTVAGQITNAQPYATYSFEGTAGEIISVEMQAVGPNLDTLLQVVDANGTIVGVNDDSVTSTNSLIANSRLLSTGTYTIIATRYGKEIGGTEGQFQVTLSGASSDVPVELTALNLPQGDIEVTLLWATSADLQLLVRDPLGQSVFDDVPLSPSGGILQENGNVNCVPDERAAPVSYIYWPLGRMRPGTYEIDVWYQNGCVDFPPAVEFTLVVEIAGQTIAVERAFPLVGQHFVTHFTVLPSGVGIPGSGGFIGDGSASLPYQPQILSAPFITSGQPASGTITPSNTFDVYSFDGSTGEIITITMAAATQTLDSNLYLISPSGNEIASNDDAPADLLAFGQQSTDAIISRAVLPENGPYTIIATRYATQYGGTIGAYTLTVNNN